MSRTAITYEVPLTIEITVVDNDATPVSVDDLLNSRIRSAASDITGSDHVEAISLDVDDAEAVARKQAEPPKPQQ